MNPAGPTDPRVAGGDEAAAWVIRLERGLTAAEQDRLSEWLAADPRHRLALARMRAHWA
ncbi:MAG: FecR/PupR family sigma factor regulator, partial [Verrucomicrobiota bacterium]